MKRNLFSFLFLMFVFISLPLTVKAEHTHDESCYSMTSHFHDENCYKTPVYHTHTESCYSLSCQNNPNIITTFETYSDETFICDNVDCPTNTGGHYPKTNVGKMIYKCSECSSTNEEILCGICNQKKSGDSTITHNPKTIITCNLEGVIVDNALSCTLQEGTNKDTLVCNQVIIGIVAKNKIQYETLDTTIIATYKDGHTNEIKATSNYDTNKTYNGETLVLSYNDFNDYIVFYSKKPNTTNDIIVNDQQTSIENEEISIKIEEEQIQFFEEDENIEQNITIIDELNPTPIIEKEQEKENNNKKEEKDKEENIGLNTLTDEELEKLKDNNVTQENTFSIIPIIIMLIVIFSIIIIALFIKFNKNKKEGR